MIMKRALLKQMRHEWRDNIWMVLGLAVVSITVWFMTIALVGATKGLFYPLGADVKDVYQLSIRTIPSDSPDYIDRGEESAAAESQDMRNIIAEIRKSPYVEAAAFSQNGLPYSLSYSGTLLMLDENDSIGYSCNIRVMSPDMVRVLRIQSLTGKSQEELEQLLRDGNILITNYTLETKNRRQPEEFYGRTAQLGGTPGLRVGDIVQQVRRSDYDISKNAGMVIKPIDEDENLNVWSMAVRVKPGMADKFRQEFEATPSMQKQGNKILYDMQLLEDAATTLQRPQNTSLRMTISLNLLLIVIVALGIMGVFWFRIQQRVGETAIRKVCGATDGDIFRRVISEGLILLLIAAIIMIALGWPLLKATLLTNEEVTTINAVIAGALTLGLLAIAIVVCIWIPARKAMRIEPAIAIKDE